MSDPELKNCPFCGDTPAKWNRRASPWRPIAEAPKGGGAEFVTDPNWIEPPKILLSFGNEGISIAYWDWCYAEGGREFTDGLAWIEPFSGDPLNLHFSNVPTHWAPLPEPPEVEK